MTHTNIYAEDMENISVSVVEKKSYTGLKIEFTNGFKPQDPSGPDSEPDVTGALTVWGHNRQRLIKDFELFLSVLKGEIKVKPVRA